jgi:hypothetical protein
VRFKKLRTMIYPSGCPVWAIHPIGGSLKEYNEKMSREGDEKQEEGRVDGIRYQTEGRFIETKTKPLRQATNM